GGLILHNARLAGGRGMMDGSWIPRRRALQALGALGVGAVAGGVVPIGRARAQAPTFGQNESVQDAMKRLFGGKTIKDGSAVIKFDIPLIAENGSVVPVAGDGGVPANAA